MRIVFSSMVRCFAFALLGYCNCVPSAYAIQICCRGHSSQWGAPLGIHTQAPISIIAWLKSPGRSFGIIFCNALSVFLRNAGREDGSCTAIRKRPPKGLLAGLYELPNTEGYLNREEALEYVKELGAEPLYIEELPDARHIFSHIEWRMKAYRIRVSSLEQTHAPGILFADKKESERNYAIPSAFGAYEKYM